MARTFAAPGGPHTARSGRRREFRGSKKRLNQITGSADVPLAVWLLAVFLLLLLLSLPWVADLLMNGKSV